MKNLKKRFVKWLLGFEPEKLKNQPHIDSIILNDYSGLEENYLFDFKNWASQYNSTIVIQPMSGNEIESDSLPSKIKIKPIDVLKELETIPNPFSLTLIDEKIDILKDKSNLITQNYAKREVIALIERLENRKKYAEYKEYFDCYQNTTDEKIDILLEKYDLVMKTSDIFIPEFPIEAIKIMKEYSHAVELVCGKKPIFYVIAEVDKFKKAYEKRDPILLVQSPFGFYWQILGAWDKEMLLLSEL